VPRSSHAGWVAPPDRTDPVAVLEEEDRTRVPELVAIRHGRMLESPFAFLRGSAGIMAADLATTPTSGLRVQACGDAHLLNFGVFATPERNLVFDLNDFDETLPAPFEWDVKRLAASVVVAGRDRGFAADDCGTAGRSGVAAYRLRIGALAEMGHLAVWYASIDASRVVAELGKPVAKELRRGLRKARRRTNLGALHKLTVNVSGERRIVDQPPLVEHVEVPGLEQLLIDGLRAYRASLPEDRHALIDRYRMVDWARKVVGVGSVGTQCNVLLLMGRDDDDPLFLQIKEAQASVLEPYAGRSRFGNHGKRVVVGQRLTQAASDIFLGWTHAAGVDVYVRQLRDMKGSIELDTLRPEWLVLYAEACGEALAHAHARTGDPVAIAGYLGKSEAFDHAVAEFADAYADQTARDHAALVAAVRSGKLQATPGV
jgi:uncharacterized protein (DUF2252 family)